MWFTVNGGFVSEKPGDHYVQTKSESGFTNSINAGPSWHMQRSAAFYPQPGWIDTSPAECCMGENNSQTDECKVSHTFISDFSVMCLMGEKQLNKEYLYKDY